MFNKFFKTNQAESATKPSQSIWIPLTALSTLEEIKELSKQQTVAIFKHSTRCGISRTVKRQFEKAFTDNVANQPTDIVLYYLDLLNHRDISNAIANVFEVIHQSPQLIVIKNGKAVHHSSHYEINAKALNI